MRRFSIREAVERSKQILLSWMESIPFARTLALPARSVAQENVDLREMFERTPLLAAESWEIDSTAKLWLGEIYSDNCVIADAENALVGRFSLLGLRDLSFGNPIDWHLEPTSGRRSPLVGWKRLDSLNPSLTGDKKVVWELNRQQYLVLLGQAFVSSGDERFAKAISEHMASWIHQNPPAVGINWVSSLEIAFRCMSWLWAMSMIRKSKSWTSLPFDEIAELIYFQACHIERFLSTYSSPNTHLTGEALGLYFIGTCLPELRHARRWRALGKQILLEQIERHVRSDGVYFEQSTWYHRYTADIYTHFLVLAERTKDRLPPIVALKLTALMDHLMWITRPDGSSPSIGDDDGGQLSKLDLRSPNDWRTVLSNGAVLFRRGDYKLVAGEFSQETFWLMGGNAKQCFAEIKERSPCKLSRAFPAGGYFVMRNGWASNSTYVLIDCGPHGVMNCGHAHSDALSIEVAACGETVLVDPGTYAYTGSTKERDLFRSTEMHNTVEVDGTSSSIPGGPFQWKHVANCSARCWHDHGAFTFFEGHHDGYRRLADPVTLVRAFLFANREYGIMLDRIEARCEHDVSIHFHMAPGIATTLVRTEGRLSANGRLASLDLVYAGHWGTWSLNEGAVSPCYAQKVNAPVGTYSFRSTGTATVLGVLYPREFGQSAPVVQQILVNRGSALAISGAKWRDAVMWGGEALLEEGVRSTDFEWVWIRRARGGDCLDSAVFLHGSQILIDDLGFCSDTPLEFVVVSRSDRVVSVDTSSACLFSFRSSIGVDGLILNGEFHSMESPKEAIVSVSTASDRSAEQSERCFCKHVRH